MNSTIAAFAALLIAMISIQFGASLAKQLFPSLGPMGVTSLRTLLAALMLITVFRPWRIRITRSEAILVGGYGISLGAMNLAFYLALERIPLAVTVTIEFLGPLAVAILSSRKILDGVWAILAIAGVSLLFADGWNADNLDRVGLVFAFIAAVGWALYILFGRKVSSKLKGGDAATLGMICAALTTLPSGLDSLGVKLFALETLPAAFGVALLSSALPYTLEMIALRNIPAKTFGILMSLEPAVASIFGLIVLHETLTSRQAIAIACVVAASAGSAVTSVRTRKKANSISLQSLERELQSRELQAKPKAACMERS